MFIRHMETLITFKVVEKRLKIRGKMYNNIFATDATNVESILWPDQPNEYGFGSVRSMSVTARRKRDAFVKFGMLIKEHGFELVE